MLAAQSYKLDTTYISEKVRFNSHVMIGRLRLSLKVGSRIEYLSLGIGAIFAWVCSDAWTIAFGIAP